MNKRRLPLISVLLLVAVSLLVTHAILRKQTFKIDFNKSFTLERPLQLNGYINDAYAQLAKAKGHDAAMKEIARLLDGQKILKTWRYDPDRNELWTTFVNGRETSSMLTWEYLPEGWPPQRGPPSSGGAEP